MSGGMVVEVRDCQHEQVATMVKLAVLTGRPLFLRSTDTFSQVSAIRELGLALDAAGLSCRTIEYRGAKPDDGRIIPVIWADTTDGAERSARPAPAAGRCGASRPFTSSRRGRTPAKSGGSVSTGAGAFPAAPFTR